MLKCYSYDIVCQEIPDEISLAVNISCCPNRCPGCHSPWLWEEAGEEMTEDMLTSLISGYSAAITCFCFMGGDAEPSEVEKISRWIKSRWPHIKTAWYSGRAELPDGFDVKVLDYLKLGPYIEELGGLKSPDTNQVFYKVSPDGTLIKSHI
ncbi:MAG: anaerobic ribonucleoside-triphosphate reductase activating protein [Bacteroidales bacterium]|nr:anaerobic ribonucleoside-triphosphate reductase activating protein [Bacteroidales bacterium]